MWDELNQYIKIPECTCGAAQAIMKSREDEKAHQFLMGLDDTTFGTVRSSILALDPLPTLGKIYAMVTQEERHRSMARGADHVEITVFTVKTEKLGRQTNKRDVDVAATVMLEEEQLQDAFIMQMQLLKQIRKKKDSVLDMMWNVDRTSRNPIGVGELRNGVYYYKPLQERR
ncbi:hypothetical protein CK203_051726 [Vitis vinifera]|uniref:Uncharacterized protein n=1 Tax=Vitis vinifera TaxID=29760 RepID=A0A438HG70_VITVI|nr:hypothetical protein CK203_051726 [Vitis vinifera]